MLDKLFVVNQACEEQKLSVVNDMTEETQVQFFSVLPKINAYMKKSNEFRMGSDRVSAYAIDKCRECVKHGRPK